MSLHKLSAGSGYDYLTRQVAALDATDKGHTGLGSYYSERGESPGVWVGSGMADLGGPAAGDVVTAEQMKALFGAGMHPLGSDVGGALGTPFRVEVVEAGGFRAAVVQAIGDANVAAGLPGDAQVSVGERARIRTQVAVGMFTAEHGRAPAAGGTELADWVAVHTRVCSSAVAGFDLTFSPVKSVSTLWAVADPATAARVDQAHQAAVAEALRFIEIHALFSRTGRGGIRQVDVTGLVAAAFTHRDSRAGDPDLHTHVAVANKVRTRPTDGSAPQWLSIDGRAIYKAATAASEVYNTSLERHLRDTLGVGFAERAPAALVRGGKRGVRELVGIDPALNTRWSQRRTAIEDRQTTLATQFRLDHDRPPTPVEALHLAQQANLETRDKKHTPRCLAQQRASWRTQAGEVLGSERAVDAMIRRALSPGVANQGLEVTPVWVDQVAAHVVGEIEQRRATWQLCHVHAETQRQLRRFPVPTTDADRAFDLVVAAALETHSVSLAAPTDAELGIDEPAALRRADGSSVYEVAGRTRYSSTRILAAEARLLAHGATTGAPVVPLGYVEVALAEAAAHGTPLNPGQTTLVREMATSQRRLQVAIAAAGTGKTTALRALAGAWTEAGGTVLALAPSAAAAAVLEEALTAGSHTLTSHNIQSRLPCHGDTLAKLTHSLNQADAFAAQVPPWVEAIGPQTLVLIDEAAMADTLTLERAVTHAINQGATVRLIGDDHQLAAVGAGGILRDLAHHHGALRLEEVMRFADPAEAEASIQLRDGVGISQAIDYYLADDRVHVADHHTALTNLHAAWAHDRDQGLDTLMVAPTRDAVRDLNHLAQVSLFQPPPTGTTDPQQQPRRTVALADGLAGGVGDLVVTRINNRRLTYSDTAWVKNGDRWTITATHPTGALDVRHQRTGLAATLPAEYVAASVELGYATTIHGAQGTTVDTLHGLITGQETRPDLYTMLTRGRHTNHVYLAAQATTGDPHDLTLPAALRPNPTRRTLLEIALRDGTATSATTELATAHDPGPRLQQAIDRYHDALAYACEKVLGPDAVTAIEEHAVSRIPGVDQEPAWPPLRATLIHAAANTLDPAALFDQALARGPLHDAHDAAAAIHDRIAGLDHATAVTTALPRLVAADDAWGPYLASRLELTDRLATPSPVDRAAVLSQAHPSAPRRAVATPER